MWNSSIAHFPWCDFSNTFWIFKNFTLLSFLLRVSTNPNTSHCLSYPSPYSLLSPSTLHHPLPTCLIYQQPFILFTFHFFTFFLLCNPVSVPFWISQFQPQLSVVLFLYSWLNCQPLPLSLHFLSLLFTQFYCPSNSLFPIFKSSSPLPSPPSSVTFPPVLPISSPYIHFPRPTCLSFLNWLFPIYHDPPCLLPQPFVASLIPNLLSFSSHFTTSLSFHFHHLLHSLPTLHTSKNIWPSSLLPVSIPLSLYPYVLSLSPTVCIYMQELTISFFRSCSLEKVIHFLIHVHALCVPLTQYDLISKIVVKCIYNLGQLKRFVNWSCA